MYSLLNNDNGRHGRVSNVVYQHQPLCLFGWFARLRHFIVVSSILTGVLVCCDRLLTFDKGDILLHNPPVGDTADHIYHRTPRLQAPSTLPTT